MSTNLNLKLRPRLHSNPQKISVIYASPVLVADRARGGRRLRYDLLPYRDRSSTGNSYCLHLADSCQAVTVGGRDGEEKVKTLSGRNPKILWVDGHPNLLI